MAPHAVAEKPHAASKPAGKMHKYRNYINGQWVDTSSGKYVPNVNPANTDDIIGEAPQSTREEAKAAIEAAKEAFPGWRNTPAPARGRILAKVVQLCYDRKEEIARTMTREEGKTLSESRGEVQKSINLLEYFAGQSFRVEGRTYPSEMSSTFVCSIRQPLGVVSCVTPWNFPFCIPVWKTAPGTGDGQHGGIQGRNQHTGLRRMAGEIYEEAGLPKGVLNLVYGGGSVVGDEFVNNPAIRAVSFTGSCETGGQVAQAGGGASGQGHLRDGRQESAGGDGRCRPRIWPWKAARRVRSVRPVSGARRPAA